MPMIDHPAFLERMSALLAPAAAAAAPLPRGGLRAPGPGGGVRSMAEALGPELRPLAALAAEGGGLGETCAALDAALADGSLEMEAPPEETARGSVFAYPVV